MVLGTKLWFFSETKLWLFSESCVGKDFSTENLVCSDFPQEFVFESSFDEKLFVHISTETFICGNSKKNSTKKIPENSMSRGNSTIPPTLDPPLLLRATYVFLL